MKLWNQELYIKAWNYAAAAHLDQKLPGSELPYITHVGNVAMEVMSAIAQSEDVAEPDLAVQCALLHDVLEDTAVGYEDITGSFGSKVADGVLALTKNKTLSTKPEQMRDSLSRIRLQPKEIHMVKLADRITNLQPPPAHWTRTKIQDYHAEAIQIHQALHRANLLMSQRLWRKIENYEKYLSS